MKFISDNGNLGDVEEYRRRINNIIAEKNHNLLAEDATHLSETLDNLIYQYLLVKKIKNVLNLKLN